MEICKICGKKIKSTELQCRLIGENGKFFCEDCASNIYVINKTKDKEAFDKRMIWFEKCLNSENIDDSTKDILNKTVIRRELVVEKTISFKSVGKTKWAMLVKFLSLIPIFLLAVIGAFVGRALVGYGDDEEIYMIVGALIGGGLGCILMSFNMLLTEIAENIAQGVDLLNYINSRENK